MAESREDTLVGQNTVLISFNGFDFDLDIPGVNQKDIIRAPYPSDGLDIQFSSGWSQALEAGMDQIDSLLQLAGQGTIRGVVRNKLGSSIYTWDGIDPVQVSMSIELVTHEDPLDDVVVPAMQLASTQMPDQDEEAGNKDQIQLKRPVNPSGDQSISVAFGDWLLFPEVLPTEASVSFSGILSTSPSDLNTAYPLKATVEFSFIGTVFPTKSDFGFSINSSISQSDIIALQELADISETVGSVIPL